MDNQVELFLNDGTVLVQIPRYPDYFCDVEQGFVYSMRTGKELKKLKGHKRNNKHDYVTTTLIDEDDQSTCRGIHEYLMAAREQSWDWKYLFDLEPNHINEVKYDNRSENLELVTRKGQYTDTVRKKISQTKQGSKHHLAKLKEDDVLEIRERIVNWEGRKCEFAELIAEEYGVSIGCINGIIYGTNWQHLI